MIDAFNEQPSNSECLNPAQVESCSADTRIEISNLSPMTVVLDPVQNENSTCATWDESAAKWSQDGVTTLSTDGSSIAFSTTALGIFGAIVDAELQEFELAFRCDTYATLMDGAAFERFGEMSWIVRPASILNIIFLIVSACCLRASFRWDDQSEERLPWDQRQELFMLVKVDGQDSFHVLP